MTTTGRRGFASDNNAGIHPVLLESIVAANSGHVVAYGDDEYTHRAEMAFKDHFGAGAEVYFVLTGTGANVLSLPHSPVLLIQSFVPKLPISRWMNAEPLKNSLNAKCYPLSLRMEN